MMELKQDTAQLRALYLKIEEICAHFKQIRAEAAGIVENSQMPDAALHLNDVLQSTEAAANTILDAAIQVNKFSDNSTMSVKEKHEVSEQIGRIFEACSFQDISGQRIKKVLKHMQALESQLLNLSELAKGHVQAKPEDSLLNGPQLSMVAPSQADIDDMFKQA